MSLAEMTSNALVATIFTGSAWAWARCSQTSSFVLAERINHVTKRVPWSPLEILMALLLMLCVNAMLLVSASAIGWDVPLSGSPETLGQQIRMICIFSLSSAIAIVVSISIIQLRSNASARQLGWDATTILADIRLGTFVFFLLAVPVYGLQRLLTHFWKPTEHPLLEMLQQNPSPTFFLASAFSAVLVAPIVEELFFRVLLQGWLQRFADEFPQKFSAKSERTSDADGTANEAAIEPPMNGEAARPASWPIFASALLFALAHYSHGPDPIPLFVLALGLGVLFQRTHRVLPCIIVHLLINLVSLCHLWLTLQAGAAS